MTYEHASRIVKDETDKSIQGLKLKQLRDSVVKRPKEKVQIVSLNKKIKDAKILNTEESRPLTRELLQQQYKQETPSLDFYIYSVLEQQ